MELQIRSITARLAVCTALCSLADCGKATDADSANADTTKTSGTGGKVAAQIKDAGDPSAPVECGTKTCEGSKGSKPCCLDKKTSFCGVIGSDTQCMAVADPRCPSVKGMLNDMASCCTVAGMCGVDLAWTGNGCVDLDSKMLRDFNPNTPAPRPCDGADGGVDAGAN